MLNSILCRYADFSAQWYRRQELNLMIRNIYAGHSAASQDFVNRKFWEWCAISEALEERCLLQPGKRGLGFAVGTEPLTSYFAGFDCTILATDLAATMSDPSWISTGQHATSLLALHQPLLVSLEQFQARVSFMPADMRTLAGLTGGYDFLWSSCALEHLGTLGAGIEFVVNSAMLLRPGGVAVHTTEFNVFSDDKTVEVGGNVIYRRQDILQLERLLSDAGFTLASPSFDAGDHQYDRDFDRPPYMGTDRRHLKLEIEGHVSTSMLLIVQRKP